MHERVVTRTIGLNGVGFSLGETGRDGQCDGTCPRAREVLPSARMSRRRVTCRPRRGGCGCCSRGLVLLSLAWGALAAFTASQYSAAEASVVTVREPLSLDALQIYQRLSDANDAATTAFLIGGLEPAAVQQRYLADLTAAQTGLEDAVARGGAGHGATGDDLRTLATDISLYDGDVQTANADNRLGLPLGAAYLRAASGLMRGTLLPKAKDLYAAENASLHGTSAHATGEPLIDATVAAGLAIGAAFCLASRWLCRRTNRVLNIGLLAAGAAVVVSLGWMAAAYAVARGDLLDAQARGSATVEALAQVGIAVQEAHADESLTLIDNAGDGGRRRDETYERDHRMKKTHSARGTGTLLTAAETAARGTPAASAVAATAATPGPGSPRTSPSAIGRRPRQPRRRGQLGAQHGARYGWRGVRPAVGRHRGRVEPGPGGLRLQRAVRVWRLHRPGIRPAARRADHGRRLRLGHQPPARGVPGDARRGRRRRTGSTRARAGRGPSARARHRQALAAGVLAAAALAGCTAAPGPHAAQAPARPRRRRPRRAVRPHRARRREPTPGGRGHAPTCDPDAVEPGAAAWPAAGDPGPGWSTSASAATSSPASTRTPTTSAS